MAVFDPKGTSVGGITISTTTREAFTVALILHLQDVEATTAKNPSNYNYITSTINQDKKELTFDIIIPGIISIATTGEPCFSALDPYTGVTYVRGTDSLDKSSNLVSAITESLSRQLLLENDTVTSNPSQYDYISNGDYVIGELPPLYPTGCNGVFKSSGRLPLDSTITPNGLSYSGKVYLF